MSKNDNDESSVTLSIRLIRSFEHRNLRFIPLRHVDLTWTTEDLMNVIRDNIQNSPNLPPPFKKFEFDTLKVNCFFVKIILPKWSQSCTVLLRCKQSYTNFKHDYFSQIEHQAHGAKSNDPVINTENDETLILSQGKHLSESNVKHETEIAFFKLNDYLQYQSTKWTTNGDLNSDSSVHLGTMPHTICTHGPCARERDPHSQKSSPGHQSSRRRDHILWSHHPLHDQEPFSELIPTLHVQWWLSPRTRANQKERALQCMPITWHRRTKYHNS